MCWRMVAREAGWKIVGEFSWVIRRVFEGGEGVVKGGRVERSRFRGEAERRWETVGIWGEEVVEVGGDCWAWWFFCWSCDSCCD